MSNNSLKELLLKLCSYHKERIAEKQLATQSNTKLTRQISVTWNADDIREICPDFTDIQCSRALEYIKSNHDASIGISWDTIQEACDYVDGGES
jgi:hypothetical protein